MLVCVGLYFNIYGYVLLYVVIYDYMLICVVMGLDVLLYGVRLCYVLLACVIRWSWAVMCCNVLLYVVVRFG